MAHSAATWPRVCGWLFRLTGGRQPWMHVMPAHAQEMGVAGQLAASALTAYLPAFDTL